MATQVEVSSALASLSSLCEIPSEASLQHAFKTVQHPNPLSAKILEEGAPFGGFARPATMPPAASRPRLTPKPFSREKSLEAFAVVKPPVPALRPGYTAPRPPVLAKAFEEAADAKQLLESVPPLADQKPVENRSPSELAANEPVYSSPQANTVILIETGTTDKNGVKLTAEKTHSPLQTPEGRLLFPKSETSHRKPEGVGIQRQPSLCSESWPASWNPRRPPERRERFSAAAAEDKAKTDEKQQSSSSLTAEVQARPKQRPVSAIFLQSLKDQKQPDSDVSEEKPVAEKSWVRKPRPLSVDLTAKFENRERSVQRKSCQPDNKERTLPVPSAETGSSKPSELGAKDEAAGLDRADSSEPHLESVTQAADLLGAQGKGGAQAQKPSVREAVPSNWSASKDLGQFSEKDKKGLWDSRLKSQDEQIERETDRAASATSKEPPSSKGQSVRGEMVLPEMESDSVQEGSASTSESKRLKGGSVKKSVSSLHALLNDATPENAEPASESLGKETRIINIQQRIKELTLEHADPKPGNLRRSFRSRPLSADLTKLFSSPAATSETKPERTSEANVKSSSKVRDLQEDEAAVSATPRKPQQPPKLPHTDVLLDRYGGFAKQKENVVLQGETPALATDHDTQTHSKSSVESGRMKTVRATMFEHNVQWHHVGADHFEAESALRLGNSMVGEHLGRGASWAEKAVESQLSKLAAPARPADAPVDAEKNGKEERAPQSPAWEKFSPREKWEKISSKHVEESLISHRIEPRYEVLQTVGKRVQSEAVTAVPEDKAVTLRSRRSLKEKRSGAGALDASGPCGLDGEEEGFASVARGAAEVATKAAASKDATASPSHHGFYAQARESDDNQMGQRFAPGKASGHTNGNKVWGVTEDKVFKCSSEVENGQSEAAFADNTEGSKRLKRLSGCSRTEAAKARTSVLESLTPASPSKYESQPSLHGSSQWQRFSHEASLARADPVGASKQDESKVFALRTRPAPFGAHAETYPMNGGTEGQPSKELDAEERLRKTGQSISASKGLERWRRKTLPYGAVRFEEPGGLSREGVKALSRRDSLQLCDGSVAKRSPESCYREELTETGPFSASSRDDALRNQLSSAEPKATYFAVTARMPREDRSPPGNAFDSLRSKGAPLPAENLSIPPTAGSSRVSHLLGRTFPDAQDSLERPLGRNRSEETGSGASGVAKKEAFRGPPPEAKAENWRSLERAVDDAKGRATAVAPPLVRGTKFSVKDLPQDSEHLGPKRSSDQKEKAAANLRVRVLDIDALMAEYGGDSKRTAATHEKGAGGLPEDGSFMPWEKVACKRNFAGRAPGEGSQGAVKGLECTPGTAQQDASTAKFHRSEKETLDCCSSRPSPSKARDVRSSPPPCGRPAAEKPKCLPPDPVSIRKKTFIIDEDHREHLIVGHQSAKYTDFSGPNSRQICTDREAEASFASCSPQVASGGVLSKGTVSKQQAALYGEDGWRTDVGTKGVNKRKTRAMESSAENSPSDIRCGAGWSSIAPTLAFVPSDLRRSYSEKAHPSRARDSFPSGLGTRERQEQNKTRQSFPPGSADTRLNKWSRAEQNSPLREGIKDQLKQCFGKPAAEAKDTDTLVPEADSQYGTWSDQRHSGDSFALESPSSESHVATARKQACGSRLSSFSSQTDPASAADQLDSSRDQRSTSLDRSSTDVDSADGSEVPVPAGASPDFSFLDQTPVLDSSVLKTRVQLSKRLRQQRAPISHSLRRSTAGDADQRLSAPGEGGGAWMFRDSTGKESTKKDDSGQEDHACPAERSPASQPQRLPVFPGMDHSVLKAQLRKRHEPDGAGEGSPVQSSKSPKSSFQPGTSSSRMLPVGTDKEDRSEEPSPQWLKDLKSKKRHSQYENQV